MKGGISGALIGFAKLLVGIGFILVLTVGASSTVAIYQTGGTAFGQSIAASVGFVKNAATGFKTSGVTFDGESQPSSGN